MKWSGAETAKNGQKCSKKVLGSGSHCRGRRFESDQVHQNEKIHLHMQMDFFILVDLIGFEPTTPTMRTRT